MTMRRTQALDVPAAELERMKATLSPCYGAELWDPEGHALLVVRVPRDEPDLVNDLEGATDYLAPGDVQAAKVTLFVGHQRSHIVPTPTLQGLMEARIAVDKAQADQMRRILRPGEHKVFQAPDDPRRLRRLALRVPVGRVADLAEAHLAPFVDALGPQLRSPLLAQVRAVHLVADGDDVRLDADLFFQDLEDRWQEEQERRALVQALSIQQAAAAQATKAGEALPATAGPLPPAVPGPHPGRTAVAPLRRADAPSWEASDAPGQAPLAAAPAEGMGEVFEVGAPPGAPDAGPAGGALARPEALRPPSTGAAPPPGGDAPATLTRLDARLQELGFVTRPHPGRHGIDLAAERPGGYPGRVVAFAPPLLDMAVAERVLAVARAVDADQALIVCDRAEPEARLRLVATRAKWLAVADVANLRL